MGSQPSNIKTVEESSTIKENVDNQENIDNKENIEENKDDEKINFSNRFIKYTYNNEYEATWNFHPLFISDLNENKTFEFWVWHPLGRGITSGIFQNLVGNGFLNGFSFGALSGAINAGMYPVFNLVKKEIDNSIPSDESKQIAHVVNYSTSVIAPWACSYFIMKKYLPNSLPRPASALFLSAMTLFVGYANRDLI